MTIKTEHSVGERVWFMYQNKANYNIINRMRVYINKDENPSVSVTYLIEDYGSFSDDELFTTKEELLKSL